MPNWKPVPRAIVFVGVDPGQTGGLAAISQDGVIDLVDMPETEAGIWEWFSRFGKHPMGRPMIHAVIERVHAFAEQGVSSSFTFGQGYGFLRGCLTAARVSFQEVLPQAWQKGLDVPKRRPHDRTKVVVVARGKMKGKKKVVRCGGEDKRDFKKRLFALAQQLFPNEQRLTLANADALLLAEFSKRRNGVIVP